MMEVAPRDEGNYIPQVIQHLTGVNLVEYSVRMAMGEPVQPPEEAAVNGFASYFAAHSATAAFLTGLQFRMMFGTNTLSRNSA